ncbi:hypothetical protein ANO14919_048840 [Xylariales sp. No.14919]|nr:hypothetical protein ANO14919_048840 [Xylariales sp. No.14919]
METISKWLDFILGPDEEDYPPATAPGRSGNGHVPVGRVVPDPQQGNISGNTGSAQVHSTSSSTGSTVCAAEPPPPAALTLSRGTVFRSSFRYP